VHTLIEGENFHALQALSATHRKGVDVIYIDPPYNTGSQDFAYNDRFVDATDNYRHSRWLRFMERRLRLAKELLKPTGVLIVAIGDDEHHRLRLLLDQLFGARNFISDVVWSGGRKNDSRFISNGADYMLVYARDVDVLTAAGVKWRERKQGLDEALEQAASLWEKHNGDASAANVEWKAWLKAQKLAGATTDSVNRFDLLHPTNGRPMNTYGNITWPKSGGPRYDVFHPVTGRPVKNPTTGWRFGTAERMQEEIDAGRVWFGPDESTIARGITYLDEMDSQVPLSVFEQDRKSASTKMREMVGDISFANPKDVNVLARWLRITAPRDAVVLDFFAGSGSTLHAVAQLNADDDGERRCILVTNNSAEVRKKFVPDGGEDGICRRVTVPRVRAMLETGYGKTPAILQRCEWFSLDYLHGQSLRNADGDATSAILPTLWLDAGLGDRIGNRETNGVYVHGDLSFAVLPASVPFGDFFRTLKGRAPRTVWVVGEPGSKPAMIRESLPGTRVRLQTGSYKDIIDGTLQGAV
jgi:adenine-specific DNA-methyltransferase